MKLRYLFVFLFLFFNGFAQDNHPVPPKNKNHLFYIQHNANHNTFVYDLNLIKSEINPSNPINIYKINYKKDGKKEELTSLQRKFAYGVHFKLNSTTTFFLSASKNIPFELKHANNNYWVEVNVNNKRIRIEKIFIITDKSTSGIGTKVEQLVIYGKTATGNNIAEKVKP